MLARHNISICDRLSTPLGSHTTITMECYDGGFTGNPLHDGQEHAAPCHLLRGRGALAPKF
jgi:hypothetical protein